MAGAVVAGRHAGGHGNFEGAVKAMTGIQARAYRPDSANVKTYDRLYVLYKRLHDAFGARGYSESLYAVMKELLAIRDEVRR